MKAFIKNLFKINLYFCAGIILVDTYNKVCEMHNTMKQVQDILTEE